MADIKEVLTLEDRFSASFASYISYVQEVTQVTTLVQQQVNLYAAAQEEAAKSTNVLGSALKSVTDAFGGMETFQAWMDVSDTLSTATARLNMVNDGLQSTAALNDMIFASANRVGSSYAETADMVSQLGLYAGDAFGSTEEIVAFVEQLNKQMAISGTNTSQAQGAMEQLAQAMMTGTMQGEGLNTVLTQTPAIAQTIADYLGVSVNQMQEMASEGQITSDVVKNAMFAAAEETNAQFAQMPATWGQSWTVMQNYATLALQPILSGISWLASNIAIIGPLVLGLGAAFAIFQVATNAAKIAAAVTTAYKFAVDFLSIGYGVLTGNTAAASAATLFFNSALMASPITWVLMGLALIVGAIYAGVAAYNHFTGASYSATGIIVGLMSMLGAHCYNTVAFMYNGFVALANFIGNVFNNPVAAVKILFYDLAQTALGYILNIAKGIEDVVNKIPGVSVDLTSGIETYINDLGAKSAAAKEESGWKEYFAPMEYKDYKSAFSMGYSKGESFVSNLFGGNASQPSIPQVPSYDGGYGADISNTLGGIGRDVGSIKKSVDMSDEDVKMVVDMATQRYVNKINLTAQTPVITVNGVNTGNTEADRKSLADALSLILQEQRAAGSAKSTARV